MTPLLSEVGDYRVFVVDGPQVILELTGGDEITTQTERTLIDDWKGLASIPAVQSGRILVLPEAYLSIPGPRLAQIVRRFRNILSSDF